MEPSVKTLIVLAIVAILFITEIVPLAVTAIGGAVACGLLGLIPMGQVFAGLANPTVVLFGGMFIIGSAMFYTGLAQKVGIGVVKMCGTSETSLMFGIMVVAAVLSAFLSNTGTTACLMPVVLAICAASKIPASRQLMPLAFAAGLGGTMTLVGTPPNLIANTAMTAAGLPGFGFFEFAWVGIPLTVAGILYMVFVGRHLLPKVELSADQNIEQEIDATSHDPKKQLIAGGTLVAVVMAMILIDISPDAAGIGFLSLKGKLTLEIAAIVGAIIVVLAKCLTEKQAYGSIDWVTIFLLAGMMPVANAMARTGAGQLIADGVVGVMGGDPGPYVVMAVLFAVTCFLTQFMSNTAAAALLAPIGISIAASLGASPNAVVMAIVISASCAFATPVGTPPNTLVLGPGGYKFADYIKPGLGLILVGFVVCMLIIPIVWPFFPS